MADFTAKPTTKKPVSDQSKNYEKNFNKETTMHGLNLDEVDGMLNEREMSLKKKIFSLPKMEALVHPDPKLSAVYNKMAEDGEEKYGYHYNETIMNIIFNDYVLNSPKYLQKYKMAVPKKKKRRDKSGIRQLQKDAKKKIEQSKKIDREKGITEDEKPAVGDIEETSTTGSVGGSGMGSGGYVTPHAWGGGDLSKGMKKQKPAIRKPIWKGGTVIQESNYLLETDGFEKYYNMLNEFENLDEKSTSKAQQRFMGMVRGVQKGDVNPKDVSQKVRKTAKKMKPEDVKDFASTKHEKLPEKVSETLEDNNNQNFDSTKPFYLLDRNSNKYLNKWFKTYDDAKKHYDTIYSQSDRWYPGKFNFEITQIEPQGNVMENKVNEHHLSKRLDKIKFIINALNKIDPEEPSLDALKAMYSMSKWSDEKIDDMYNKAEAKLNKLGIDPMSIKITEEIMNEHHLNTKEEKINFIFAADKVIDKKKPLTSNEINNYKKIMSRWNDEQIDYHYRQAEAKLNKLGIDPMSIQINEETDQTMISGNPESMANKPRPEGEFGGGVPMGMQDSGGLRESEDDDWWDDAGEKAFASMEDDDGNIFYADDDIDKDAHKIDWKKVKSQNEKPLRIDRFMKTTDGREMFEGINEELEAFSIHQNKLKSIMEDKKPSSLVLKDRLGKENESNFKSDMKNNSTTKDVVKMEKDMMWKEQQTNVGNNPYKNGEDLEKATIKTTKGNALKNVGNSDGTKGEIPKRNLTTKEQEDVDEYRLGQQDLVYDNAPDEKFEERMKAGMGEEMYKKRQEKLKKRAEYPMYNKEERPIGDTAVDKVQFNKEKSSWNEREGLKESVLTGKYVNELNKRKLVDFKLSDVKIVESINGMFKVDFTGMGNSTDSRGNVNEAINSVIDSHKFYTNGKTVVAIKNPVKKLNESEKKKKPIVNEEYNKMKHLLGYDPKKYIDTKRNKI